MGSEAQTLLKPTESLVTSRKSSKWQRRHIENNLYELCSATTCTNDFLEVLKQAKLLSKSDEQELEQNYSATTEKSKRLYEILITRKDFYCKLREALEQTNQVAALEILDNALLTDILTRLNIPLDQLNELKSNINAKDANGFTLLHRAARLHKWHQLEQLRLLRADLEARSNNGLTPLHMITCSGKRFSAALSWFAKQGVNLNATDNNSHNLAHLSAFNDRSASELEQVIRYGVKWQMKNKKGQTVMHLAAEGGNVEALSYFKSLGADVNARDDHEATPLLQLAVCKQHFTETLSWFVEQDVDLNALDSVGNNLVLLSAFKGRSVNELEQVINSGVNWHIRNKKGQTVLHLSAAGGNIEALEYFKSSGAYLNARDVFGFTPLLWLAYAPHNFTEILNWFARQGVDLNVTENIGRNLSYLCFERGRSNDEIEQIISYTGVGPRDD